jgi:hypothetical protein
MGASERTQSEIYKLLKGFRFSGVNYSKKKETRRRGAEGAEDENDDMKSLCNENKNKFEKILQTTATAHHIPFNSS